MVFRQSGYIRAQVVLLVQSGCIRAKLLFSGKSCNRQNCCIRTKVIVFGQRGCVRSKVVVFVKSGSIPSKRLYSGKSGSFRAKWL